MKFFVIMFFIISITLPAWAGKEGGGADSLSCQSGIFEVIGKKIVLADIVKYYDLFDLSFLENQAEAEIELFLSLFLKEAYPQYSNDFEYGRTMLNYKLVDKVSEINTGFRVSIGKKILGCGRKQIARQNFESQTVSVHSKMSSRLTKLERVLLKFHEGLLAKHVKHEGRSLIDAEKITRGEIAQVYSDPRFISTVSHTSFAHYTRDGSSPGFKWFGIFDMKYAPYCDDVSFAVAERVVRSTIAMVTGFNGPIRAEDNDHLADAAAFNEVIRVVSYSQGCSLENIKLGGFLGGLIHEIRDRYHAYVNGNFEWRNI